LRGGKSHTNYDAASVDDACALLVKAGLPERVMIDCSHANSRKLHRRQRYVCRDICAQITDGDAWEDTVPMLEQLAEAVRARRNV